MPVNKQILERVIYKSIKSSNTGTLIQDRVFEDAEHGIPELSEVDFTGIDVKTLVASSVENNDEVLRQIGEGGVSSDYYISVVSSQLYHLMLNFVKIPTNEKITDDKTKLYVCSIALNSTDNVKLNRKVYNCICFLGLPLNTKLIVEQSIYEYLIKEFSDALSVELISEHEMNYKLATIDKIEDNYEVMSITRQETYSKRCREVMSYKQNHPKTEKDNSRLDNLQYYLIEQQLCFGLYLGLKPILSLSIVKFNRIRKLSDHTGNLFLSFRLTDKALNETDKVRFIDIVHLMLDYGFFGSFNDIEDNIRFASDESEYHLPELKDSSLDCRDRISEQLGKNNMYSLLFRLLDSDLSDELLRLDDLILSKKHAEFDAEVLKLLS